MFSVKTSLSCISLNARGLRNSVKRKAFFFFVKTKVHTVYYYKKHILNLMMLNSGQVSGVTK